MVLKITDHVDQCYTGEDGAVIRDLIKPHLIAGEDVTVSFDGVSDVASSFVNAAFVDLLDSLSYDQIRSHLRIVDSKKHINRLILRRFEFEVKRRQPA